MPPSFDELWRAHAWRPIHGCPGRFVLRGGGLSAEELLGEDARWSRHRVAAATDEVLVCPIEGGGIISFQRADGSIVHTLNTEAGFARRLQKLGLP